MPARLGITCNIWRESTTQLPAVYAPPRAATPCHTVQKPHPTPKVEPSRRWDVVPPVLEINGRTATCPHRLSHVWGVTHTLARRTKLVAASNPLTQAGPHNLAELRIRSWDVVPSLSKSSRGCSNVQASRVTCATSYAHIGLPHTAHLHPQPPDSMSNHALERRKLGALTWLL